MKPLRVLALTRYGALGASSRLRFYQYYPILQANGIQVQSQPLFGDALLQSKYKHGQYGLPNVLAALGKRIQTMLSRHDFDLLWIEKEALPWCPLWLESGLLYGVPYVLDYDDAVFHNYDANRSGLVRRLYGKRLDELMSKAALVVCGNTYLAKRASMAKALLVEQLPTVIDLERYPFESNGPFVGNQSKHIPRIVWIGSPSTVKYLALLSPALKDLALHTPFVLRIIGAQFALPGVQVECLPWDETTEAENIAACDLGVMPLQDSAWERGKCGYKLIQYMACGLPVVASDVGVNHEIVHDGVNGYLARTDEEWLNALRTLLRDDQKRVQFGQAGRARVEDVYCIQKTGPVLTHLLAEATERV